MLVDEASGKIREPGGLNAEWSGEESRRMQEGQTDGRTTDDATSAAFKKANIFADMVRGTITRYRRRLRCSWLPCSPFIAERELQA